MIFYLFFAFSLSLAVSFPFLQIIWLMFLSFWLICVDFQCETVHGKKNINNKSRLSDDVTFLWIWYVCTWCGHDHGPRSSSPLHNSNYPSIIFRSVRYLYELRRVFFFFGETFMQITENIKIYKHPHTNSSKSWIFIFLTVCFFFFQISSLNWMIFNSMSFCKIEFHLNIHLDWLMVRIYRKKN